MILPATLLALVLVQLPASLTRRGGPLMLTALALVLSWSGRRLADQLGPAAEIGRPPAAPVVLAADRFIELEAPGHYVLADRVNGRQASGVVILDTTGGTEWRLRHLAAATIESRDGRVGGFSIRDRSVYGELTAAGEALTALQRDLEGLIDDVETAESTRDEIVFLLAPIAALAGLGFLVRRSRWPLIGAALALAFSRGALIVYRVAKDEMYAPLAERLGGWSHLFPALVLMTFGALLVLADALTHGEATDA